MANLSTAARLFAERAAAAAQRADGNKIAAIIARKAAEKRAKAQEAEAQESQAAEAREAEAREPQAAEEPQEDRTWGEFAWDVVEGMNPFHEGGAASRTVDTGINAVQGATMGWGDELAAVGMTAYDALRGRDIGEAWDRRIEQARDVTEGAEERAGTVGTMTAQGVGGAASAMAGGAAAGGIKGGSTVARLARSLLSGTAQGGRMGRVGAAMGNQALIGGATGAGHSEGGLRDRAGGAAVGSGIGAATGLATGMAAPIASGIVNRFRPRRQAGNLLAEAVRRSGRSADDIDDAVRAAVARADDGSGVYTPADEMGRSGHDLLVKAVRQPGRGSQFADDFLTARQRNQTDRIGAELVDALQPDRVTAPGGVHGSPARTAAEYVDELARLRSEGADAAYAAVRKGAGPVDVSKVLAAVDDAAPAQQAATAGEATRALRRARGLLVTRDGEALDDFASLQHAKWDLDDMIERGSSAVRGRLMPVKKALVEAMEEASPGYREANRAFRASKQAEAAVKAGGKAAKPSHRAADTLRTIDELARTADGAAELDAFRMGYLDDLLAKAEGVTEGTNFANRLAKDKTRAELEGLARTDEAKARLARVLSEENAMAGTNQAALGGSRTADNLAALGDAGGAAEMVSGAAHGNPIPFIGPAVRWARGAFAPGEEALERTARALLSTEPGGLRAAIPADGLVEEAGRRVGPAAAAALTADNRRGERELADAVARYIAEREALAAQEARIEARRRARHGIRR